MLFWLIWLLIGALWELYAIATKESKYLFGMQIITLSRTIWRIFRFEDRSYDKHERTIRYIFMIILGVIFGWLIVHLGWGPCAYGWC
jgi:hypothetical protein